MILKEVQNRVMKKAEDLDKIAASNISELITIEEADKIVSVWGLFLEHAGFVTYLFPGGIPESILPYPKFLIVGAINKMIKHYHEQGLNEMVKLHEEVYCALLEVESDQEAASEISKNFGEKKWLEQHLLGLKELQKDRMEGGFIVNGELWKLSSSRIDEIKESMENGTGTIV